MSEIIAPPINSYVKRLQDQLKQTIEQGDSLLREEAKNRLFIFNKFVLDVEKGKMPLGDFHRDLCKFVEQEKTMKKLLLLPRGHLKSTLITIGYSTQQIVKNPNVRILILNATWQVAVDFVTEIKRNLQQSPNLLRLYGDLTVGATEWSQDRITLARTDTNIKGPTVWGAGVGSNLTGTHPDIIIMDDVVSRDNTQTIEQIEKVKLSYRDALDLLEPGGQLIIIGTRWTYNDFYSWIIEKQEQRKNFLMTVKRSYIGDLNTGQDFQALWPEKFTREELLERREEKGPYEFSSQYQNDPVSEDDADFKQDWFQYYDPEDYRGARMNSVMTIDPAISEKKSADYTAIGVYAADQFQNHFIKDLYRGHWKVNQIIDSIFYVYELWHPQAIILETISYQKALAYMLNLEMQKRGVFLPIIEKAYHDRSKEERIRSLQPLYAAKKVYHNKALSLNRYLEEELIQFPRSAKDDLIDTFAMALDYLVPPRRNERKNRYHSKYLY